MVSLSGKNYKLTAFLLLFIVLCLLDLTTAAYRSRGHTRRRFRCSPKLCRNCRRYVHSRWRRSLDTAEVELDDAHDSLIDQNIFGYSPNKRMSAIDQNLKLVPDVDVEMDKYGELSMERKKPRIQKRSATSHLRRCMFIVKTPCCVVFGSMVTFIGH